MNRTESECNIHVWVIGGKWINGWMGGWMHRQICMYMCIVAWGSKPKNTDLQASMPLFPPPAKWSWWNACPPFPGPGGRLRPPLC